MSNYYPHILITALVLLIGGLITFLFYDAKEWERYKVEHNCERTEHLRMVQTMVCQSAGRSVTCIPNPSTEWLWRCDNGTEHWRPG